MDVSIVVSTRNRGERVLPAVESILRSQGCQWELIIIDQSTSDTTERALKASGLLGDRHLTYRRTASVGLSRGLNEGIRYARGSIVAFTADDCLVPLEWAAELVRQFASMPDLAVHYASVLGPPDAEEGWILEFRPLQEGFVRLSPRIVRSLGLTANLSVRRSALAVIGPFDEFLGVGGTFGAAEDTDFGYRALRAGLKVYTAQEPAVTDLDVRRADEVADRGSRSIQGMVAMCMKHARCGDFEMLRLALKELRRRLAKGTGHLLHGRRPSGYRAAAGALYGILGSFRYRVDKKRRLYRPWFNDVL